MKKRILFVDDEPNVLQALRRMLRTRRHEWEMEFAESGKEALELLEQGHFDVVVSDMRMPVMDGAQLLIAIRERYPHIVRIILSGQSDREMALKSVGPAHQYLAKPCDAELLKNTVARACSLREVLADDTLGRLVSGLQTLPSLPKFYHEIINAIQTPDASLKTVGKLLERDMGMSAKILQLVNSTFFGLRRHVSSPAEAVGLLGLDTVKTLILSVQIFTCFDPSRIRMLSLSHLWEHSRTTSALARRIALAENCDGEMVDYTVMAGLLHDIGKLVLASDLPDRYSEAIELAKEDEVAEFEAEYAVFGASHAEIGAYLLGLWGLPAPIVEALAFHHRPTESKILDFNPLTAVHVADALAYEKMDHRPPGTPPRVDSTYLEGLGLTARLSFWCEQVNEPVEERGNL